MTYTISRYPVHLIDVLYLPDGTRLTIRPTLPQDVELQRAFFRTLSAKSRYCRFMNRICELPDSLAERFGNIDYRSHVALLVAVFDAGGQETMIAEARYVMDEHEPGKCEFAIAVADEWQSRGIGTVVLARLEREAARARVEKMTAIALTSNVAMLALAECAGYSISPCPGDAEVRLLEKALSDPPRSHNAGPLAA